MKPAILFRAMDESDHPDFAAATTYFPGPQFGGIVAFYRNAGEEVVMGMVGLDGWMPKTVMAHWWIRHPRCLLPLWGELLAYLTKHGKRTILGTIPSDNERSLRTVRKLGWTELYRIKDAWDDGVDLVIMEYRINARIAEAA